MNRLIVSLFVFATLPSFCQTTFFIKDFLTKEPIPFSKIIPNKGQPSMSDIDGAFQITDSSVHSVFIRSFGYSDTTILLNSIVDFHLYLQPIVEELEEVVVLPGENPAHRIMNLVIANRKKNSPTENEAFSYDSYSKFMFDLNPDAIASIPDSTTDSLLIGIREYFESKHLFLFESASKRTFIPPSRNKEEIIAFKVSGFSDPLFSTFANELQSFSFYENQFQVLGKTYINPIAFGGTRRYLFILEDTTVIDQDTTFTISFRPRKGKNFDGLKGRLYINTHGYAVEKVISEPYIEEEAMHVKIVQEYILVNNKRWFPSKLSTEIELQNLNIGDRDIKNVSIQGKGNTYIKNILFNPPGIKKYNFDNSTITTAVDANKKEEMEWDSIRPYVMTSKEQNTYLSVDSLSKVHHLDYKFSLLKILLEGKIPLGNFNLDALRIYDFNRFEENRLGLGLETSEKWMKKAVFGGYFAYGTKDQAWKYGGFADFHLYRKKEIKLRFTYRTDVVERGVIAFQKDNFKLNSNDILRHLYIQNMDQQQIAEAVLSGMVSSNFKISLIGNYQRIFFTEGYQYTPLSASSYTSLHHFDAAETGLEIRWNIREKVLQLGNTRVSRGTNYPKIIVHATKGWKGWADSNYDYWRLRWDIQQDFPLLGAGKFNWCITGGKTLGNVPLFLQQNAFGTRKNGGVSIQNTFETMPPSAFYSSQQIALFTRFHFLAWRTPKKWFTPQLGLYHGFGFGSMNNSTEHSFAFKTMERGYFETGVSIDKIINFGYSGVGIALFDRYGPYSSAEWRENLVFKIRISMNF
jgi:hypothetical protein